MPTTRGARLGRDHDLNFLFSIPPGATLARMRANLELDTGLYHWNAETVGAIRDGLRRAFKAAAR